MRKGISMIALISVMVIMIVLITTITISGINTANNSQRLAFSMEITMIQEAVDSYYIKNNKEYPKKNTVLLDISTLNSTEKEQFTNNGEIVNSDNKIILYEIDYSKIGITDLKYGTGSDGSNDVYVVSSTTGKVYYAKGLNIGNKLYFAATSDVENMLNYNSSKNEQLVNPAVTFTPTTNEWTNQEVSVIVKVPSTFIDISVEYESSSIEETEIVDGYNIYNVTVNNNSDIVVKYKVLISDTDYTEVKYNAKNIDIEPPVINVGNPVNLSSSYEDGNIVGYIQILSKMDELSGIKKVQYVNESVELEDAKDYFATYGIDLDNDVIMVNKDVSYITVFAEDNAGNITTNIITINL